ncbi:hypothetical protein [Nonomuraea sp. GTA35]|uniref:hypothetical protein n=1 Tax=Nonomuraea sp. GTA35 TaxID=1676746 RepID=UPI0035C05E00
MPPTGPQGSRGFPERAPGLRWPTLLGPPGSEEAPEREAGRAALEALRRLGEAIAPTQGDLAIKAGATGRLLAGNGRYEFAPLRIAEVDQADVDILAAAARVLGDPHASQAVRDGLEDGRADLPAGELVKRAAQLAGLLDLADTGDTVMLRERLAAAGPTDDVVLTRLEEDAYRRTVTRLNAMWALGDPLARFIYARPHPHTAPRPSSTLHERRRTHPAPPVTAVADPEAWHAPRPRPGGGARRRRPPSARRQRGPGR